jgi:23S rRNA (guanosine2251-2'-O)-methyltransferase
MPDDRKHADPGGAAELVFGTHAVRHALESSPADVLELRVARGRERAAPVRRLVDTANARGVKVVSVDRDQLDRETGYAKHQGIAAVRRRTEGPVTDLETLLGKVGGTQALILVLDGVQDPHNLGACVRTADAAGADAVVIPRDRAAPLNATARKVASGAAEHIPIVRVTNLARALRQMQEAGIWIVGTAADAEETLYEVDLTGPAALVLGGEGAGLRQNVRNQCDRLVRLPMRGAVESLNVSVAAAITLYEALRQRTRGSES